jgi:uncharacterized protein DUF4402
MKRIAFALAGLAAMAIAGVPTASAQLISISKTADLGFGTAFIGSSLGTVVVTPAGARTASGGVTLGSTSGVGAAQFTVSGIALLTYHITLPSSIALSSGGSSMTVNTFTSTPSGSGTFPLAGTQTLTVGATLQVGAVQAPGTYSGSFNVTVSYN